LLDRVPKGLQWYLVHAHYLVGRDDSYNFIATVQG
jgi:hypothetical protein